MICRSPIDGAIIGEIREASPYEVAETIERARKAAVAWRVVPAPQRGQLVNRIAGIVRTRKSELADIIVREVGKIPSEAEGEVQEWIDICDFAVGLSRQLYGLTIASERPNHRMMEQWHPLGVVGVITAFNFPMAVWAWNAMLALVCGDSVIWKPSEKGALCAEAVQAVVNEALADAPAGLCQLIHGGSEAGRLIAESEHIPLVSATGSVPMGKKVAVAVAERLGRSLLELGGNNALIVAPSADLNLAIPSIVFAAAGTAGQRCTTLRRLIVHESILSEVLRRLHEAYSRLAIGDPRHTGILVGPLIDERAWLNMQSALEAAVQQGGSLVFGGGRVTQNVPNGGFYARPAIVQAPGNIDIVREETFAPILYVMEYRDLDDAIALQNGVRQGLSSAIFSNDVRETEWFISPAGSDCGIANINIGTSGAEIGGAFGGEKETGGGRESGSDAWKAYMRRVTNTINYGRETSLAQNVRFET